MRSYFVFPQEGHTLNVTKHQGTGQIQVTIGSNLYGAWFSPESLTKQLRGLADHIEKYGTDGRLNQGKFPDKKAEEKGS